MLRRSGWDGESPIRLVSCDSGDFASDLAKKLDVDVTAPRGLAWTDTNGNVFAGSRAPDGGPTWPPDGGWDTHHPDGSNSPASDDAFHPSKNGEDPGDRPDDAEARDVPEPEYPTGMTREQKLQDQDYVDHHYTSYTREDGKEVIAVNPNRSPDLDGEEPPPIRRKRDENGPVTDEDGNPVYEENPKTKRKGESPEFADPKEWEYGEGHPKPAEDVPPSQDATPDGESSSGDGNPDLDDQDHPSTQDWREESLHKIDEAIEECRARMDERDAAKDEYREGSPEYNQTLGKVSSQSETFGEVVSDHAQKEKLEADFNEPGSNENTLHPSTTPDGRDYIEIKDSDGNVVGTAEQRQPPGAGSGKFDSVWEVKDLRTTPPETRYDVIEAKAPHAPRASRELPDGRYVQQCRRDYLEDVIKNLKQHDAGTPEHQLGKDLQRALDEERLHYEELRAKDPRKEDAPDGADGGTAENGENTGKTVDVYDGWVRKPVNLYDDED
ncbi:hypothetical protein [Saccharopolyspora spinosa]|uniref:hypothetical protein n=1 Tax=Saccharopolyspora spinosa TaxID=60894 RepID=UPI001179C6A7|nr:hypothetical protein [Saccharopolyspora spinosa]